MRLSILLVTAWCVAPALLFGQAPAPDSVRGLIRAGRAEAALTFARDQTRRHPTDAWAHHALALAALARDDHDGAVAAAERCVELAPTESRHHEVLGDALFAKAGATGGIGALGPAKRGRAAMERALELDPDNLGARDALVGFHVEAPGIAGGSKAEAARHASELQRRDVARGAVASLRLALATGDDYGVAIAFEQGLHLVAAGGDTVGRVRAALLNAALQVKKDADKDKLTSRLYATLPDDLVVRYARARLWIIQGKRLPEAIALLRAYIDQPERPAGAPSVGGAHWRMGQALERLNREPEALAEYRRAVELLPQLEDAKRDLTRLERKLAGR